jgi:aryl-alcohol dehydrogenase-like predicted oxidoreductase
MEESLGAIKEMQSAGKIRHFGLSEVSVAEIERARKTLPVVSVQNRYNVEDRKWDKVIDYCEKENLAFLPWFPVGGGRGVKSTALDAVAKAHNASVYQVALAWLLQRSPVMLPIPGTSNIKHLEDNAAAAKLKLTPEEWKSLAA